MNTSIVAVAAALLVASVPAFAAEEYFTGPALNFADRAPSLDTGSAQTPRFDGLATTPQSEQMLVRSGSEAEPESLNSQTSAYPAR